jgi:hypothetical protein
MTRLRGTLAFWAVLLVRVLVDSLESMRNLQGNVARALHGCELHVHHLGCAEARDHQLDLTILECRLHLRVDFPASSASGRSAGKRKKLVKMLAAVVARKVFWKWETMLAVTKRAE